MADNDEIKLTHGQILYRRHFPEIIDMKPDDELHEYAVKNPFFGPHKTMQIDEYGFFRAEVPIDLLSRIIDYDIFMDKYYPLQTAATSITGFYSDFMIYAEGITEDEKYSIREEYLRQKYPPDMEAIKAWQDALFSHEGKSVLDYLMNDRGLNEDTIKANYLGFHLEKNELVIPAMNLTKQNPIAVKFVKFPIKSKADMRIIGPECIYGYHNLTRHPKVLTPKYITTDEIDSLYLRQLGFEAYCSFTNHYDMDHEWTKYFLGMKLFILGNLEMSSRNIEILGFRAHAVIVDLKCDRVTDFFNKEGKSQDDFQSMADHGLKITNAYFTSLQNLREIEAYEDKDLQITGPQDNSPLGFLYGAIFNKKKYFLAASRQLENEQAISKYQMALKKDFTFSRITKELVEKFTRLNRSVNAHNVFNAVKRYIKTYIFFKDEEYYDILSIWAMGTYVFTLFRHYPYVHIQAEKNSGKSEFMTIMAEICFNGKHYVNATGAVIFREADSLMRTMFIDEAEGLGKRKIQGDLMELLNAGFQRGATVPRIVSKDKGGLVDYNVYCPKMFAGISDINDVLQSRSIHLKMLRKLPEEIVSPYRSDDTTTRMQAGLREDLYMFGLLFAEKIKNIYENDTESVEGLKTLENRQRDLWTPMFIIANIIDAENKNTAISTSLSGLAGRQAQNQAEKNLLENSTTRLLLKLNDVLGQVNYVKIDESNGDTTLKYLKEAIYKVFESDKEWKKEFPTKNKLTMELRKIGVGISNEYLDGKPNNPCYIIDVSGLYEFGKRYGVEFTFFTPHPEASGSSMG